MATSYSYSYLAMYSGDSDLFQWNLLNFFCVSISRLVNLQKYSMMRNIVICLNSHNSY